jgi:hypothetical protein
VAEKGQYRILVQVFTFEQTIAKGEAILSLAKQHQEQSQVLSACAAIIMAAALEQATWSVLVNTVASAEIEGDDPKPYTDLMKASLRQRIKEIPQLLTKGKMQFNDCSNHAKSLLKLLSFRNALLHINEDVAVMNEADSRVRIEKDKCIIKIPKTQSLWDRVTPAEASQFRDAVSIYIREILKPEHIRPGEIVRRSR